MLQHSVLPPALPPASLSRAWFVTGVGLFSLLLVIGAAAAVVLRRRVGTRDKGLDRLDHYDGNSRYLCVGSLYISPHYTILCSAGLQA